MDGHHGRLLSCILSLEAYVLLPVIFKKNGLVGSALVLDVDVFLLGFVC